MINKKKEDQLIVAIYMVAYNHENYIAKAVESVMMQITNFKYKLFIGEDFSTDKTRKICIEIKEKYPNKIELLLQSENTGGFKNSQDIYKICYESDANYIALCEGDDYWIDPFKLQKQVDFLEKNPTFSCCAHKSNTKYETETNSVIEQYNLNSNKKDILYKRDFMHISEFHTSSILLKKQNIKDFINVDSSLLRDNPLKIFLLQFGPIKILSDVMSTYRRNSRGISENISIEKIYKTEIDTATALGQNLQGFYFKSLFLKSHWHRYYLINGENLSLLKKLKLFFKFLIPSFYRFPRNIRDILSSIYNGFLK